MPYLLSFSKGKSPPIKPRQGSGLLWRKQELPQAKLKESSQPAVSVQPVMELSFEQWWGPIGSWLWQLDSTKQAKKIKARHVAKQTSKSYKTKTNWNPFPCKKPSPPHNSQKLCRVLFAHQEGNLKQSLEVWWHCSHRCYYKRALHIRSGISRCQSGKGLRDEMNMGAARAAKGCLGWTKL